ncbi:AfsR/SARP family transcriptional regulator [Micromonospora sp. NPDC049559]|uniref:AfsR/SARP family transcriptional regulator n=1 Tax=Micromonospora sp. NPDC049559 TaxID=3155923 RepID=UPI0034194776
MKFSILGPLEVRTADASVELPALRHRRILAALLLAPGGRLSTERLIEAAWDSPGPPTARKQVQNCVAALRRRLIEQGASPTMLVTRPGGYQLDVPDDHVDARIFTHLVELARRTAQDQAGQAVRLYRSALTLWRGRALEGLDGHAFGPSAAWLTELRLTAAEECFDLELSNGLHLQAVPDLVSLAAENLSRERLQAQLMTALHRCGRQVETFQVYQRVHDYVATEIGSEPGVELKLLRERLLRERGAWP